MEQRSLQTKICDSRLVAVALIAIFAASPGCTSCRANGATDQSAFAGVIGNDGAECCATQSARESALLSVGLARRERNECQEGKNGEKEFFHSYCYLHGNFSEVRRNATKFFRLLEFPCF